MYNQRENDKPLVKIVSLSVRTRAFFECWYEALLNNKWLLLFVSDKKLRSNWWDNFCTIEKNILNSLTTSKGKSIRLKKFHISYICNYFNVFYLLTLETKIEKKNKLNENVDPYATVVNIGNVKIVFPFIKKKKWKNKNKKKQNKQKQPNC